MEYKYFIINKPFNILSQFTGEDGKSALSSVYEFPKEVYPVGRLDYDSEGLLILTNDNYLKHSLLNPENNHNRTYLVQVEGNITLEDVDILQNGVQINSSGKIYVTKPAIVRKLETEPVLPDRDPPIRFRKEIPTSWLEMKLKEGRNRQVRKMTAAVGFPTLRLIRISIEGIELRDMQPGAVKLMSRKMIYKLLNIVG